MTQYKVGVIGCGKRGRAHAEGYQASAQVAIVGLCRSSGGGPRVLCRGLCRGVFVRRLPRHARKRSSRCGEHLHVDWPAPRDGRSCGYATGVKAIHCEKPMASTWGDAKALARACADRGVLLTFCHQRRFGAPFVKAKQLLDEGAIGDTPAARRRMLQPV